MDNLNIPLELDSLAVLLAENIANDEDLVEFIMTVDSYRGTWDFSTKLYKALGVLLEEHQDEIGEDWQTMVMSVDDKGNHVMTPAPSDGLLAFFDFFNKP